MSTLFLALQLWRVLVSHQGGALRLADAVFRFARYLHGRAGMGVEATLERRADQLLVSVFYGQPLEAFAVFEIPLAAVERFSERLPAERSLLLQG